MATDESHALAHEAVAEDRNAQCSPNVWPVTRNLPPSLLLGALHSGMAPERWPIAGGRLTGRLLTSLLGPPVAMLVVIFGVAMLVLLGGAVTMTVLNATVDAQAVVRWALGLGLGGATSIVIATGFSIRRASRRARIAQEPLDRARPLMIALCERLLWAIPPRSRAHWTLLQGQQASMTLPLRQGAHAHVDVVPRVDGMIEVVLDLPVAPHTAVERSWPDPHVSVSPRGAGCRVCLELPDDDRLDTDLVDVARPAAHLCRTQWRATGESPIALGTTSSTELVVPDAPDTALATRGQATAGVVRRGVVLSGLLRGADAAGWVLTTVPVGLMTAGALLASEGWITTVLLTIIVVSAALTARLLPRLRRVRRGPRALEGDDVDTQQVVLEADGHTLRVGPASLDLAQPFDTTLTRASTPSGDGNVRELTVELRQGRGDDRVVLRMGVLAHDDETVSELAAFDVPSVVVDSASFTAWLWPTIRFYAAAHGSSLPAVAST